MIKIKYYLLDTPLILKKEMYFGNTLYMAAVNI